jgi:hypothetical protein
MTETSYIWPSSPPTASPQRRALQKRLGHNRQKQAVLSLAAPPTAVPSALAPYRSAEISSACLKVVKPLTSTVTVEGPTRTLTRKAYVTQTGTTTIVASRTTKTRYTSVVATSTRILLRTSLATSTSQLPDQTNTLVLTDVLTSFTSTTSADATKTQVLVLAAPRRTVTATAVVTLSPVPFDYKTIKFPNGVDQLPDYSWAGYHQSNDPLPPENQVATQVLEPTGDDTDRTDEIQAALEDCGPGGVVGLRPGNYVLFGSLRMSSSNCILRGSLQAEGDPVVNLTMAGTARDCATVSI